MNRGLYKDLEGGVISLLVVAFKRRDPENEIH